METEVPLTLTPEQVAAIDAAEGVVHARDPATHRRYVLLEQVEVVEQKDGRRLTEDELRAMLQEGLDQIDRGEGVPWDPERVKDELRRRYHDRGIA